MGYFALPLTEKIAQGNRIPWCDVYPSLMSSGQVGLLDDEPTHLHHD